MHQPPGNRKRALDIPSSPVNKKQKHAQKERKAEKELSARVLRGLLGEPEPADVPDEIGAALKKPAALKGVAAGITDGKDAAVPKKAARKSKLVATKGNKHDPEHVEGVFSKDGDLYLRDTSTNRVFSSVRDKMGSLVLVGMWDSKTACINFNLPDEIPTRALKPASQPPVVEETEPKVPRFRPRVEEDYPFVVEEDDHCETGAQAYSDIKPFLAQLCQLSGKTPDTLRIYDPYYCAGSVIRHLSALGYDNVYNKNEDFYAKLADASIPEYDVLITNPPYSEDHIERLLKFCVSGQKPWLLLIPNYIYTKPFYASVLERASPPSKPIYVVPKKRYCYWTPKGIARNNPKVRKDGRTSPFITFWYADFQKYNSQVLRWWQQKGYNKFPLLKVVKDVKSLPESVMEKSRPLIHKGRKVAAKK